MLLGDCLGVHISIFNFKSYFLNYMKSELYFLFLQILLLFWESYLLPNIRKIYQKIFKTPQNTDFCYEHKYCLKRERATSDKIKPILSGVKTAFGCTPALVKEKNDKQTTTATAKQNERHVLSDWNLRANLRANERHWSRQWKGLVLLEVPSLDLKSWNVRDISCPDPGFSTVSAREPVFCATRLLAIFSGHSVLSIF